MNQIELDEIEKLYTKKDKFILDKDKNVIPANLLEWGEFLEHRRDEKIVKKEMVNGYRVSTVFLGLDHGYPELHPNIKYYKPLIFETMIFKGKSGIEEYCNRYSTWQEAEEGHEKAVEWVKNGCKEV